MYFVDSSPSGIFTGHKQLMKIYLVIPLAVVKKYWNALNHLFSNQIEEQLFVVCPYVRDAQGTPLISDTVWTPLNYETVRNGNGMNPLLKVTNLKQLDYFYSE